MIIDSHVHFWNYDALRDSWITDNMKILQQDYLPQHLLPLLRENEVDGCVAVQADQSENETLFLAELSISYPFIKGVVGWIDLQQDNIEERLEYFSRYQVIRGWRHIVQAEPEDFLARKEFLRGIRALGKRGYTYDLLIYQHQLKQALNFVAKFPEQKIIIDHCAKPDIRHSDITRWETDITEMARYPNLCCKLSGLLTETNWNAWKATDFYPYLDIVIGAFGPDRLLFGSDWPVMQLSGSYQQWKSILEKYLENYPAEYGKKIFGTNAMQIYNL